MSLLLFLLLSCILHSVHHDARAMHRAEVSKNLDKLIKESGDDKHILNTIWPDTGQTYLTQAIKDMSSENVQLLLEKNANPTAPNRDNKKPSDICKQLLEWKKMQLRFCLKGAGPENLTQEQIQAHLQTLRTIESLIADEMTAEQKREEEQLSYYNYDGPFGKYEPGKEYNADNLANFNFGGPIYHQCPNALLLQYITSKENLESPQ